MLDLNQEAFLNLKLEGFKGNQYLYEDEVIKIFKLYFIKDLI